MTIARHLSLTDSLTVVVVSWDVVHVWTIRLRIFSDGDGERSYEHSHEHVNIWSLYNAYHS